MKKINSTISTNTKAQIETMGLLVIVILVSLVLLFVLSFNINKARSADTDVQDFKELQAVSNFGTTMLETTDSCGNTVRELLTDCAFTNQMKCGTKTSCETASDTISEILDFTLNEWGYEYNLTVSNSRGDIIITTASGCIDSLNSEKETTPFGTTYGSMILTLKTCG